MYVSLQTRILSAWLLRSSIHLAL